MEEKLEVILDDFIKNEGNLISILQDVQSEFGYIPEDAVNWFSDKLDIPASRFYGVVTFYSQFHLTPRGKNIITACCGTACHVNGSAKIIDGLRRELKLAPGEETTKDGKFTLEEVACLGTCSFAPVVLINGKVHGKTKVDKVLKEIKPLGKSN
jgi:NADH:ubiquinone oxidoreductase subunit E